MMRHIALAGLLIATLAALPTAAADHVACTADPDTPQAVRTACGIAASGGHFVLSSGEVVLDYALCFLFTAPINWASCL